MSAPRLDSGSFAGPPRSAFRLNRPAGSCITAGLGLLLFWLSAGLLSALDYPAPQPGDYVVHDFRFRSGEVLPEMRMHYLTLGTPRRDEKGVVRNAVLVLHGTTGNGSNFIRADFAGELFGKGQLLDASRYYLVLPDNIGHGKSAKPSDKASSRARPRRSATMLADKVVTGARLIAILLAMSLYVRVEAHPVKSFLGIPYIGTEWLIVESPAFAVFRLCWEPGQNT
jgi:hypothetical protein